MDKDYSSKKETFQKNFWSYLNTSNFGIFKKFIFSFLIISLVPLLVFSVFTLINISSVKEEIVNQVTASSDQKTKESMELQAVLTAESVRKFLRKRENDLFILKQIEFNPQNFRLFSLQHKSEIWQRTGTNKNPSEAKYFIPLYKEISLTDAAWK